jgi:hypothetical protein
MVMRKRKVLEDTGKYWECGMECGVGSARGLPHDMATKHIMTPMNDEACPTGRCNATRVLRVDAH